MGNKNLHLVRDKPKELTPGLLWRIELAKVNAVPPMFRYVDRTHAYRLRLKERELSELRKQPQPPQPKPRFNRFAWKWRSL